MSIIFKNWHSYWHSFRNIRAWPYPKANFVSTFNFNPNQTRKREFRIRVSQLYQYIIVLVILLPEKFLQFDWLRAVVFQLNLKYLHVKITNLSWVVV